MLSSSQQCPTHDRTPLYLRHHPDLVAGCTRRACGRLAVTALRGRRLCKAHILERMAAQQSFVFQFAREHDNGVPANGQAAQGGVG